MTEFREAGDARCEHLGCGAAGTAYCCFCLRRMCSEHIARVSLFTLATCFVPWPPHLTDLLDDLASRRSHARLWLCEDCQLGGYHEHGLESENSVDLTHTGVAAHLPQNLWAPPDGHQLTRREGASHRDVTQLSGPLLSRAPGAR